MTRYLVVIFLSSFSYCNAQNYLDSTSTWYYEGGSVDFSGTMYTCHHIDYVDGDTMIGPYSYHKLYEDKNDSTVPNGIGNYVPYDTSKHNFMMFLREINHEFYSFNTFIDSDRLLINFNLHLNDVVAVTNGCSEAFATIRSIDTVYLGNIPRRRFIYDHPSAFILEGVGTYMGINNGCDGDIFLEGGTYLTCFGQNGSTLSLSSTGGPCNIPGFTTAIGQVVDNLNSKVFPNPAINELTINADCEQCAMELHTITGQQITEYNTLFTTHMVLKTERVPKGIYLLKISDKQSGALVNSLIVKQ